MAATRPMTLALTLILTGGFSRSMNDGLTSGSRNERKLSKGSPPRISMDVGPFVPRRAGRRNTWVPGSALRRQIGRLKGGVMLTLGHHHPAAEYADPLAALGVAA